ncbi:MAG: DUF2723 domain-containing protein, partial [Elusimicrobiota bacterium]|nr:DUF2723 domain-containing protein [Elusimicrobiota bacterium]
IWTILIPFGNIGYRLNLFSAFTSSLTVVMVYFILKREKVKRLEGKNAVPISLSHLLTFSLPPLLLAFSTAFWRQSILAEIYSMNALFTVLIVYLLFSDVKAAATLLAAFLFGLGLGNHHTLVLLLPGIIYLLIKRLGKTFLPSTFYLLPAFLLGFSVYIFLPVRATQQPLNNWGNPQTISGFVNVLMRTDYGTVKLSSRHSGAAYGNTLTDSAKMFWQLFRNQFGWLGIILTASGVFFCFRNPKSEFGKTMLIFFLFTGPFFIFLSRLPNNEFSLAMLEPACVLSSVFIALIIGMGISGVINIIKGQVLFFRILPPLFIILPVFLFYQNFQQLDKRNNFLTLDYGKNLLRSIPKNSYILMTADIPIFTVNYLQNVEKMRRDVKVILSSFMPWRLAEYEKKYPEIFYDEKSVSTVDTLLKKSDKEPVFTEGVHPGLENYVSPQGLACRVLKDTTAIQKAEKVTRSSFLFEMYPLRKPKNQLDYYEKTVISYYTDASVNAGVILSQAGRQKEAETEFQRKSEYEK